MSQTRGRTHRASAAQAIAMGLKPRPSRSARPPPQAGRFKLLQAAFALRLLRVCNTSAKNHTKGSLTVDLFLHAGHRHKMKIKQTFRRSRMRALAACVTVCLLLLQGFASTCHGPSLRRDGSAVSALAQPRLSHCSPAGDTHAPAHDCCAYCSVAGRDALTQFVAVVVDYVLAPAPRFVAALRYETDILNPSPLGLTRSWSSRAPPRLG